MVWWRKYGDYLFWGLLLLHCAVLGAEPSWAAPLTKLALMPLLLVLFYAHTHAQAITLQHRRVYLAFLAAYLGDALLIKDGTVFFLGGMLAFMLTHVLYILFFLHLNPLKNQAFRPLVLTVFLLGNVSFGLYVFLLPHITSTVVQKGILVYMCLIGFMAGLAAQTMTHPQHQKWARLYLLPGALSFVASDAVLAANLFYFHEPLLGKLVMLTYGFAQWRLLHGFVHCLKPHQE